MARAADCRSAGPWLKSGCALPSDFSGSFSWSGNQTLKQDIHRGAQDTYFPRVGGGARTPRSSLVPSGRNFLSTMGSTFQFSPARLVSVRRLRSALYTESHAVLHAQDLHCPGRRTSLSCAPGRGSAKCVKSTWRMPPSASGMLYADLLGSS